MASASVSVRLSEEVLGELEKLATEQGKKVSDVVRSMILAGLKSGSAGERKTDNSAVLERLDDLRRELRTGVKAAIKAQFLANMSASFSADLAKTVTTGQQPSKEEKAKFLEQIDGWAEDYVQKHSHE